MFKEGDKVCWVRSYNPLKVKEGVIIKYIEPNTDVRNIIPEISNKRIKDKYISDELRILIKGVSSNKLSRIQYYCPKEKIVSYVYVNGQKRGVS